jgi:medium-chain acyl-[acyl-carrier-protein] hydrolase
MTNSERWIYRRARDSARLRLFCIPFAGGGSSFYSPWQAAFPDEIEVCALELPGRRRRVSEPPFRRAGPLVAAMADGLAPYLGLPFALFGHSMGGLLAFELARTLHRTSGLAPRALFLSAVGAPHLRRTRRPLWNLPDADFLEEVRAYGGIPEEALAEPGLMEMFLPALRADFEIFDTYELEGGEPVDCPVYLYGGEQDPFVAPACLAAWIDVVPNVVSAKFFSGGHFYLSDHREALTEAIARALGPRPERSQGGP